MNIGTKLMSGRYFLCVVTGVCIFILTLTICNVIWNGNELNNSGAMILGTIAGAIGTVIASYFKKDKEDERPVDRP